MSIMKIPDLKLCKLFTKMWSIRVHDDDAKALRVDLDIVGNNK